MRFAIVVSAGRGQRIGFKKQFLDLCGTPMWLRSTEAMFAGGAEQVLVVVAEDDQATFSLALQAYGRRENVQLVVGGDSRHASVSAGMRKIWTDLRPDSVALEDILVAVHDAARPFVTAQDVTRTFELAQQAGASVLGRPCRDTVKLTQGDQIVKTIPRDALFLAETPQVVRGDVIERAYFTEVPVDAPTDDSSLVEQLGLRVACVQASGYNGKVTTPDDLEFARWLAHSRWGGTS